ncbi:transcription factor mef2A-like [Panonychus citri]|uniref:transcription factor mef2A-like n=1 Tax=Panonychus citri TaxID=50023 RepID=UPI002307B11A|nr:transcription factor mef2A-like [Panonychus citri]
MFQDSVTKHPLKKRVFYLDVKSHQNRNRLKSYLTKLGGLVSEFLDSKEVRYLITDRQSKDLVREKIPNGQDGPTQGITPSKKVNDLLPRGKQFALAAQPPPSSNTTNEHNIDVIELANRRGIKILSAQTFIEFCLGYINEKDKLPSRQSSSSTKTITYFKGNFIKVEEMEEKYKPSAKIFTEWPQIYVNTDPFVCPFIPPSKVKRTSSIGDINNARNNNNNPTTNETGGLANLSSKMPPTPELRGDTPKPSTNQRINDLRINNGPVRKPDTLQYCEICGITFINMNEHIASNTHQSHLKQEDNFKDLFNVMKSLPKWIEDDEEIQNVPSDNSICDSSYPVYPSLTPPTSSKLITLTPGSTTVKAIGNKTSVKAFLSLHDLYNNNNNNKINSSLKVNYQNDGSVTSAMRKKISILGNSNNNNNANNIAANVNVQNSRNNHSFKIANLIYNNNNNNHNNHNNNHNNDTSEKRKIIGTKLVDKFNFDQLFSDDEDETGDDMVEASCFTPPLLPPLLYPELDIPEENLKDQSIKDHFDVENGNYTDAEYDFDEELFASFEKDVSVEF